MKLKNIDIIKDLYSRIPDGFRIIKCEIKLEPAHFGGRVFLLCSNDNIEKNILIRTDYNEDTQQLKEVAKEIISQIKQ